MHVRAEALQSRSNIENNEAGVGFLRPVRVECDTNATQMRRQCKKDRGRQIGSLITVSGEKNNDPSSTWGVAALSGLCVG
jgi:hypothetical protein